MQVSCLRSRGSCNRAIQQGLLQGSRAAERRRAARAVSDCGTPRPAAPHHRLKIVQHCAADAKLLLHLGCGWQTQQQGATRVQGPGGRGTSARVAPFRGQPAMSKRGAGQASALKSHDQLISSCSRTLVNDPAQVGHGAPLVLHGSGACKGRRLGPRAAAAQAGGSIVSRDQALSILRVRTSLCIPMLLPSWHTLTHRALRPVQCASRRRPRGALPPSSPLHMAPPT